MKIRLLLFLMFASISAAFAMESQGPQESMLVEGSPALKVQEKIQEEENIFSCLPDELMMHILPYLNKINTASTPKEAVEYLRAVGFVNRRFERLLSDDIFTEQMLQALITKFPQETQKSPLIAALFLHTAGALRWLNNNDEDWRQQVKTIAEEAAWESFEAPRVYDDNLGVFIPKKITPAVLLTWLDIPEFAHYFLKEYELRGGITFLMRAVEANNIELVNKLLALGADPNAIDNIHTTAVNVAAEKVYIPILERLLNKGGDPNIIASSNYYSTLMVVVQSDKEGSEKVLKLLLNAGANPDNVSGGYTPLMLVVESQRMGMIKMLLEAGANPDTMYQGISPRSLAQRKSKEVKELIENSSQLRCLGFIRDERLSYSPEVYRKLGVKPYARPHEILDVKPNATQKEIDAIYKKLTNHYRKLLRTNANDSDIASILSLIEWAYKKVSGI